jgi:hypothetical protein
MKANLYWLDANVFIQAKNGPYSFKLVPQFWVFIAEQLEQGCIRSSKMVYDELIDGNDDLAIWMKQRREKGLRHPGDQAVQQRYTLIANYTAANYKSHQSAEFMMGADGWLIAHAMDGNGAVVTQESDRSHKSKIKIPTICKVFGVPCINTYQMLNALGANFST